MKIKNVGIIASALSLAREIVQLIKDKRAANKIKKDQTL